MEQSPPSYIQIKHERRENKKISKRDVTGEEVIFIFEKVLESWPTIRIYNTIIQTNPNSGITKQKTEKIATGNCKIFKKELSNEQRLQYYTELREKVYKFHLSK
jgi:hypothetical protein